MLIRGVFSPTEVEQAAAGIEAALGSPGPLAQVASSAEDPGAFVEDFRRWHDIPEIESLAKQSQVPRIAAELMGSPTVRLFHDHVLVKEGGTRQRTPWHQDQPYYNVDGRGVSAWIPVDRVPEAGCLELVAGTHRGPWLMPRTFLDGEAKWFPENSLTELPDIDADRGAFVIRRYEMEPGDAIFFRFPDGSRRSGISVQRASTGAVAAVPLGRRASRAKALADIASVRRTRCRTRRWGRTGAPAVPARLAALRFRHS